MGEDQAQIRDGAGRVRDSGYEDRGVYRARAEAIRRGDLTFCGNGYIIGGEAGGDSSYAT